MPTDHVKRLAQIGLALSTERNIHRILEMILEEARSLGSADGGTLYILDENHQQLRFEIVHNDSLDIRMGGCSGTEVPFPPVPLRVGGRPNHSNVSSHVALTGETVNIADLYQAEGFDFSGAQKYDQATGYRTQSLLVIPMRNHEQAVIGVLQLINARHPETGAVGPFSPENVDLIASLASQAAVAITNRRLIESLSQLFEDFIQTIAAAIDEKSPYTGGHIRRVTELTGMIAEKINASQEGPFANVQFSEDELEELRIAAWMHDIGKIALPEHVVSKRTKLEILFDRIHLIESRFQLIGKIREVESLAEKLQLARHGKLDQQTEETLDRQLQADLELLEEEIKYLSACNRPSFLQGKDIRKLKAIAQKTYTLHGETHAYLSDEELEYLSVRRGNLISAERKLIESHALMSIRMLNKLPFPAKLARVPEYAGGHHEKLDGSGYPLGLKARHLPLQARIIALADVFEALTAQDRPYKKPINIDIAFKILREMKENQHIDPDLYDLLLESGLGHEYIEKEYG